MTKGFRAAHDFACSGARVTGTRQAALRGPLHQQRAVVRWYLRRTVQFLLLKPQRANRQFCHPAMKEIAIPTDALARFRAAASEFTGDAKRRASRLEPAREDIAAMRAKGASFRTISEMLSRCGIRASDTCVMRFCRRVLGEQPVRAARAKSRVAAHKNGIVAPKTAPVATGNAAPSTTVSEAAQVALLDDLLNCPPLDETKSSAPGGPRIAKIKFANPNEL